MVHGDEERPERSMTRTVLLGGLFHETHTFLKRPTTLADFESMALNIGPDVVAKNLGNQSPTDGFLSYTLEKGWEIVPTIQMAAMPGGTVEAAAIELFRRHFFPVLDANLERLDGIFLILHGAMVSATTSTSRSSGCSTFTPMSPRR
jgi:microcystin degradation protein MlrC